MKKADCYHLGYVAKLHGFKGEVSLFLDVTNPNEYQEIKSLFIDINGMLTPFFVERYQLKPKSFAQVKFEEVNSENDAKPLLRKDIYLPLDTLPELDGVHFYDHEVVGFEIHDLSHGKIGTIIQIIDLAVNPLIQVDSNGKEVLIPFVKDLIQEVDRANKILKVKAPEGLLGIYL
jgi:16S rRNA processing protein RimM